MDFVDLYIRAECSWDSNIDDKDANDTITTQLNDTAEIGRNFDIDFDSLVKYETSVNFVRPSQDEKFETPYIKLEVDEKWKNLYVDEIALVCGIRAVEIFGEHSMYLKTIFGTAVDDDTDYPVYEFRITFPSPLKTCVLKFINTLKSDNFWIFGIQVFLSKMKHPNNGAINYDYVEQLLENVEISNDAKNCIEFFKNVKIGNKNTPVSHNEIKPNAGVGTELKDIIEIKRYIDDKFQELAERLECHELRMNQKLNEILEAVKNVTK